MACGARTKHAEREEGGGGGWLPLPILSLLLACFAPPQESRKHEQTHLPADHDDARQLVRQEAAGRAGRVAELRANLAQAVDEPHDALEPLRGLVGGRHDWEKGDAGGEMPLLLWFLVGC